MLPKCLVWRDKLKTENISGNFQHAVEFVISYLVETQQYDVLAEWDKLRGNDWVLTTRLSESKNRND